MEAAGMRRHERHGGPSVAAGRGGAARGPRWLGPPVAEREGRRVFEGFEDEGQQYHLGDNVYLTPAEPGVPPYIGRLHSLHEDAEGAWATVKWYYRPSELEMDNELTFNENEIFAADEEATHHLDTVSGRCVVLAPGQLPLEQPRGERLGRPAHYVCSRKYIPEERRVVPLDDGLGSAMLQQALQERPCTLVYGHVTHRLNSNPSSAEAPSAAPHSPAAPSRRTHRQQQPDSFGLLSAAAAAAAAGNDSKAGEGVAEGSMHNRGGPPGLEGAWGQELEAPSKRRRRGQQQPAVASPAAAAGSGFRVRKDLECGSPVAALAAAIMPPAGVGAPGGSDSRSIPPLSLLPRRSRGGAGAGAAGTAGGAVGSGGSGEGFSPSLGSGATDQHLQQHQQPGQQPRRQSSDTVSGGRSLEEGGGTPRSRAQREQYGRWSRERYEGAQRSLVGLMRATSHTTPDRAILRPTLREEARRLVGDTGLLDHLLKHMADQVVSPEGDRLRRRHNKEGHMVYWLQSPAAAEQEEELLKEAEGTVGHHYSQLAHSQEELLKEEVQALSSELREVVEARHLLHAVREEATQAIQAVSGIVEKPEEGVLHKLAGAAAAAAAAGGSPAPAPGAARLAAPTPAGPGPAPVGPGARAGAGSSWAPRLERVEAQTAQLQAWLEDARSLAVAGPEEVRREGAEAAAVMGGHLATLAEVAQALVARCTSLEGQLAAASEEGLGRYEALASLLLQVAEVQRGVASRDERIEALEGEVARLGRLVTGTPSARPAGAAPSPTAGAAATPPPASGTAAPGAPRSAAAAAAALGGTPDASEDLEDCEASLPSGPPPGLVSRGTQPATPLLAQEAQQAQHQSEQAQQAQHASAPMVRVQAAQRTPGPTSPAVHPASAALPGISSAAGDSARDPPCALGVEGQPGCQAAGTVNHTNNHQQEQGRKQGEGGAVVPTARLPAAVPATDVVPAALPSPCLPTGQPAEAGTDHGMASGAAIVTPPASADIEPRGSRPFAMVERGSSGARHGQCNGPELAREPDAVGVPELAQEELEALLGLAGQAQQAQHAQQRAPAEGAALSGAGSGAAAAPRPQRAPSPAREAAATVPPTHDERPAVATTTTPMTTTGAAAAHPPASAGPAAAPAPASTPGSGPAGSIQPMSRAGSLPKQAQRAPSRQSTPSPAFQTGGLSMAELPAVSLPRTTKAAAAGLLQASSTGSMQHAGAMQQAQQAQHAQQVQLLQQQARHIQQQAQQAQQQLLALGMAPQQQQRLMLPKQAQQALQAQQAMLAMAGAPMMHPGGLLPPGVYQDPSMPGQLFFFPGMVRAPLPFASPPHPGGPALQQLQPPSFPGAPAPAPAPTPGRATPSRRGRGSTSSTPSQQ
ncbi:hypothetical protein N2152v2_002481 [Parachlorella kessleri]